MNRKKPIEPRFWSKVKKTETCWYWTAAQKKGYGLFAINGRQTGAHRFSYELKNGPIKDNLVIDHKCRTTLCVNPNHLRAVTAKINVTENVIWVGWQVQKAKKFCPQGHHYSKDNTYFINGKHGTFRRCKKCSYQSCIKYRKNKKNET